VVQSPRTLSGEAVSGSPLKGGLAPRRTIAFQWEEWSVTPNSHKETLRKAWGLGGLAASSSPALSPGLPSDAPVAAWASFQAEPLPGPATSAWRGQSSQEAETWKEASRHGPRRHGPALMVTEGHLSHWLPHLPVCRAHL
jgi:hypothetical protein